MSKDEADYKVGERLLSLLGDSDLSKRKQVSQMMPDIRVALKQGHSVKAIHSKVKAIYGLDITYPIFLSYVRFERNQVKEVIREVFVGAPKEYTPPIKPVKLTVKEEEKAELNAILEKFKQTNKDK